jgi:DNA-binding NtrC family response regulator
MRRVLVVEPVPRLRSVLVDTLEGEGYAAAGFPGLVSASRAAALAAPDVLVVDERVLTAAPEAFRALRTRASTSGALVVAISRDLSRSSPLMAHGVHCVIPRSLAERRLLTAVRWVLDVYRAGGDDREQPGAAEAPGSEDALAAAAA